MQGTHAQLIPYLYERDLKYKNWYRSKETVPVGSAFVGGGFLSNKKWPLIEV